MDLLTSKDLAEMLGLKTLKTIDNWLQSGTLPRTTVLKIGRMRWFKKEAINKWLESCAEQSALHGNKGVCYGKNI